MSKKVLITGGSGLLGSHITEKLIVKGFTVNHLSRNPEKSGNPNSYHWDPQRGEFNSEALNEVDFIINLSGAGIADEKWSPQRKKIIRESRTKSTGFLRDQLKKVSHQVQCIISVSATGYYGYDNGDRWQRENSRFGDDFMADVIKEWEEEAKLFESLGLRVVILRAGVVLSNRGGALPRLTQPTKYGIGAALGSGQQWISWIHIDDLADAFLLALSKESVRGIYNVVAPNPVTNNEFTKASAKALKKPLFMPNVPKFVLKLVFGEMATTVLSSCRASPAKIIDEGFTFQYQTIDVALKDLLNKR